MGRGHRVRFHNSFECVAATAFHEHRAAPLDQPRRDRFEGIDNRDRLRREAGFDGARALGVLTIPGGGQDSPARLAAMETLGATVLVCTPSYALHLAEVAQERGVDLSRLAVRATVHAGEPGAGIPAVRARIESAWGARAYDHAGMTEMGAYGFECAERAGLHVNEGEFIAEIIDPLTGAPAPVDTAQLAEVGVRLTVPPPV